MFLVIGVTGRVGGTVARHLLAQGKQMRALVRDRAKAADWADQGVDFKSIKPMRWHPRHL